MSPGWDPEGDSSQVTQTTLVVLQAHSQHLGMGFVTHLVSLWGCALPGECVGIQGETVGSAGGKCRLK